MCEELLMLPDITIKMYIYAIYAALVIAKKFLLYYIYSISNGRLQFLHYSEFNS